MNLQFKPRFAIICKARLKVCCLLSLIVLPYLPTNCPTTFLNDKKVETSLILSQYRNQNMGKREKRSNNNGAGPSSSSGVHTSLSIREEASGRKQSHNPKSMLKLKHLQNLAVWASGNAQAGSLGAFFGHSFADFGEAMRIPPGPSLFPCQRCETILQPGSNCTVRIEKNHAKRRKQTKFKVPAQNNVVYTCRFCSHRNLKRGTPKGYVKEIAPSRIEVISSKNEFLTSAVQKGSTPESSKYKQCHHWKNRYYIFTSCK